MKAYGGDSFFTLKDLSIEDKYKGFRFGQSNSPIEPDIQHNYYRIHHNAKTMYEKSLITFDSAERRHLLLLAKAIAQYLNQLRKAAKILGTARHQRT